jgi:hypothetical protein
MVTPTLPYPRPEIVAEPLEEKARTTPLMSPAEMTERRLAARKAAEAYQSEQTLVVEGYTIRPAIGKTGGGDNVGWELIPAKGAGGPPWYVKTRERAIESIPRHRATYQG